MKQQQNKHSSKNYKKNRLPAKLIKTEFIAINTETNLIIADFDSETELKQYAQSNKKILCYMLKTYKLNNKQINTKQTIKND